MSIAIPEKFLSAKDLAYIATKCTTEAKAETFLHLKGKDAERYGENVVVVGIKFLIWHFPRKDFKGLVPVHRLSREESVGPLAWRRDGPWAAMAPEVEFRGELRDSQLDVYDTMKTQIHHSRTCYANIPTGGGKTVMSLSMAASLKMRALIVVDRVVLEKQWIDTIAKFFPGATYTALKNARQDVDADFVIAKPTVLRKLDHAKMDTFGTLIIDEAHMWSTDTRIKILLGIHPKYTIALSATPKRPDGLDCAMRSFVDHFDYKQYANISRLTYTTVHTSYTNTVIDNAPPMSFGPDENSAYWTNAITEQADIPERNDMIAAVVAALSETETVLVLCRRMTQVAYIKDILVRRDIDVDHMGAGKTAYRNARVLVATTQMCGVGFDKPDLTTVVMAGDSVAYMTQYVGRCARKSENVVRVVDFVDDAKVFEKHLNSRLAQTRRMIAPSAKFIEHTVCAQEYPGRMTLEGVIAGATFQPDETDDDETGETVVV